MITKTTAAAVPAVPGEWTRQTAAAFAAALDPAAREMLGEAIREHADGENMGQAVEAIRAALAAWVTEADGPGEGSDLTGDILGVIFTPSWYDNGYFFNSHGHVVYADGSREPFDAGDADEAFTELFGVVSPHAGFAYSTHTGETEYVEQGVEWELEPWLHAEAKRHIDGVARYAPVQLSPRGAVHAGSLTQRDPARYNPLCPAGWRGPARPVAAPVAGPVTCAHCRSGHPVAVAEADRRTSA